MLNSLAKKTKTCSKCGEVKTLDDFKEQKGCKDGCRPECRDCTKKQQKEYYEANKVELMRKQKIYTQKNANKISERSKKWRAKNRDKCIKKHKDYYEKNKVEILAAQKVFYEDNKELFAKRTKKYRDNNVEKLKLTSKEYRTKNKDLIAAKKHEDYLKNPEKVKLKWQAWHKSNPEKSKAINTTKAARRRCQKLQATPAWADEKAIAEIYLKAQEITKITGVRYSVDHIIPLQGELVSGLHVENNLEIISLSENCQKNNKFNPLKHQIA